MSKGRNYCEIRILSLAFVVVVVLLFNVHGKHIWSCRGGQLT